MIDKSLAANQKAPACICSLQKIRGDYMKSKASITVEASVVCPIFIFAAVALIEIIRWFGYAEIIQRDLSEKFYKEQYISYITKDSGVIYDDLDDIYIVDEYVYDAKTFGLDIIKPRVSQSVVGRAYTGVMTLEKEDDDVIVYITPYGKVYHESGTCTYLKSDIYRIDYAEIPVVRNDSGGKYYGCERCINNSINDDVYITPYGSRFHNNLSCSAIRKNYIAVYKSNIENRKCCSKCGGD